MKKKILIVTLFLFIYTIYSCSVDETESLETQGILPQPPDSIKASGVNIRDSIRNSSRDTLLLNKNNKALMLDTETGDFGVPPVRYKNKD